MEQTVVGFFSDATQVQTLLTELKQRGYDDNDLSVVAHSTSSDFSAAVNSEASSEFHPGAGAGATLGGVTGFMIGLASLAVPGVGAVLAAGPLVSALAVAGIGAAAGGLVGALMDLGVSEPDAQSYAEGIRRGGALLTIHAVDSNSASLLDDTLRRYGADSVDIHRRERGSRTTLEPAVTTATVEGSGPTGRPGFSTAQADVDAFETVHYEEQPYTGSARPIASSSDETSSR